MKEDQSERLVVVGDVRRMCARPYTRVCITTHTHTKKQSCLKPLLCAITRRKRCRITPATTQKQPPRSARTFAAAAAPHTDRRSRAGTRWCIRCRPAHCLLWYILRATQARAHSPSASDSSMFEPFEPTICQRCRTAQAAVAQAARITLPLPSAGGEHGMRYIIIT